MWTTKKTYESDDGMRNVALCISPDGKLFRFDVYVWMPVTEDELLYHPDGGYWSSPEISGYYNSLSDCENAARGQLSWLNGAE